MLPQFGFSKYYTPLSHRKADIPIKMEYLFGLYGVNDLVLLN